MDEEIKAHLDAIAELVKGKKIGFHFLMQSEAHLHINKNCTGALQAEMMFNYIESKPEVHSAFTDHVYSEMAATEPEIQQSNTDSDG